MVDSERVKDLLLIEKDLSKIIIIDNTSEHFESQKENGILIKTWQNDKNDKELFYIIQILKDLIQSDFTDVRKYLKNYK